MKITYIQKKKKKMEGENEQIEPSTMNYVFDMFGKSVAQMLQTSLNQQTMIDELRAQLRSVQTQVTNICNTLEDFEDKLFIKVQEMRPTVYTRDGVAFDDAIEMLQNKVDACNEKTQAQSETLEKHEQEIKNKLDADQYEQTMKETQQATESYQELFLTIQTLQKDLAKQRQETDNMTDRVMQMVQLKLEHNDILSKDYSFDDLSSSNKNGNNNNGNRPITPKDREYVTKSYLEQELQKIRDDPFGLAASFVPSGDKAKDQFAMLQLQQENLDKMYLAQKQKLGENYDQLLHMLDNEGEGMDTDVSDDFSIGSDFDVFDSDPDKEVEYRSISIDNEGNVDDEEVFTTKKNSTGKRRSIGLLCNIGKKANMSDRQALIEQLKQKKLEQGVAIEQGTATSRTSGLDEKRIQASIITSLMGKVENMLVDFFSMQSGLKLDKNDAKVLVSQLSVVQQLKDDITKLKLLMNSKKDAATCDQELEIRITRVDFFNYLATIFPNNPLIQKCLANINSGLPPLNKTASSTARPKTTMEEENKVKTRNIKTSQQPSLVPARNSRLLALNQKFLRGADGRYYLRDMGTESSLVMTPNITGSQKKDVQAEEAFDFQPFTPSQAAPRIETNDRPQTTIRHRTRTPPDSLD